MTDSNQVPNASSPPASGGRTGNKAKTTIAGVVIAALLGGYTMFRPAINEATGWNLPAVTQQQRDAATSLTSTKTSTHSPTKSASKSDQQASKTGQGSPAKAAEKSKTAKPAETMKSGSGTKPTTDLKRGPLAGKFTKSTNSQSTNSQSTNSKSMSPKSTSLGSNSKTPAASQADPSLKYGVLREIGRERYISPAGLLYTPGSAEGHRLEHLRRHTADQPSRPGKHGVFDGGMEGALASIDKAYEKAKAGQRTTKETDGNRIIYTVDMGKRIGFVGGRDGNRQRKPMARRLRMVLEGNRVITAFPL